MNRLFLILCFLVISNISKSQIKALTENGKEVLLFEDGTWTYSKDSSDSTNASKDFLVLNNHLFVKSTGATFLVKSQIFNVGIFMNPSKWTFSTHRDNEKNPEYRFSLKSGEGYAVMVTEKTQIEIESLRKIALMNAEKVSADFKETSAEYRMVNGKKMICLRFQGTVQGIKINYIGYYYSNPNGTVQLLCYSSKQYFDSVQTELERFLNGLVEIEK